jgi:hypothetical protein
MICSFFNSFIDVIYDDDDDDDAVKYVFYLHEMKFSFYYFTTSFTLKNLHFCLIKWN